VIVKTRSIYQLKDYDMHVVSRSLLTINLSLLCIVDLHFRSQGKFFSMNFFGDV